MLSLIFFNIKTSKDHTLNQNNVGINCHIGVVIPLLQDGKQQLFSKGSSVTRPKEWSQVKQVKQR